MRIAGGGDHVRDRRDAEGEEEGAHEREEEPEDALANVDRDHVAVSDLRGAAVGR